MKLLVSVVDAEEAIEAFKGGADIIDIKNPSEGALGANFPLTVLEIRNSLPRNVELSATIGDLPHLPGTASYAALGAAASGVEYIKVGLFGSSTKAQAIDLMKMVCRSVKHFYPDTKVIACCYADYSKFNGLNPSLLPIVTQSSSADGLLIDVKDKDAKMLFDFIGVDELKAIVGEAHSRGITTALAGGLGIEDVESIRETGADIMGVRRSVCNKIGSSSRVQRQLVQKIAQRVYMNKSLINVLIL